MAIDAFAAQRELVSGVLSFNARDDWSTPLFDYRAFGAHRLMSRGEGIWHAPAGEYVYLRFGLDAIDYSLTKAQ